MGATLRVDPDRLRAAAAAETEVGAYVAAMCASRSTAGADVELRSGDACRYVGALLDAAATAVHGELASHAGTVNAAAESYQRADEQLGGRLAKFTRDR